MDVTQCVSFFKETSRDLFSQLGVLDVSPFFVNLSWCFDFNHRECRRRFNRIMHFSKSYLSNLISLQKPMPGNSPGNFFLQYPLCFQQCCCCCSRCWTRIDLLWCNSEYPPLDLSGIGGGCHGYHGIRSNLMMYKYWNENFFFIFKCFLFSVISFF